LTFPRIIAVASVSSLGLERKAGELGCEFTIDIIFYKGVYVCN